MQSRTFQAAMMLFLAVASGTAYGQPADSFFKGKTLTIYSGHSPGGSYSEYARFLARHIGKHIPGQPLVVNKFMPGANGLTVANWIYNSAPRDGLSFAVLGQRMAVESLLAPHDGIRFEGNKFTWLGSMGKQPGVCVTWHASSIRTLDDAKNRQVVVGAPARNAADSIIPRMMNEMIGTKFQVVGGYIGTDIFLAMERGEVDGRCGVGWVSIKTARPDLVEQKKINVLAQFSLKPAVDLPHVPLLLDLVPDPDARQALKLFFSPEEIARPFAAPPGVPPDRVAVLRAAFSKTITDPEFVADTKKAGLEIDAMAGEDVQAFVDALYATPRAVVEKVLPFITGPGN
jgi:tripartite-type tricarboxylate transporter receptor subunit TctC